MFFASSRLCSIEIDLFRFAAEFLLLCRVMFRFAPWWSIEVELKGG